MLFDARMHIYLQHAFIYICGLEIACSVPNIHTPKIDVSNFAEYTYFLASVFTKASPKKRVNTPKPEQLVCQRDKQTKFIQLQFNPN